MGFRLPCPFSRLYIRPLLFRSFFLFTWGTRFAEEKRFFHFQGGDPVIYLIGLIRSRRCDVSAIQTLVCAITREFKRALRNRPPNMGGRRVISTHDRQSLSLFYHNFREKLLDH